MFGYSAPAWRGRFLSYTPIAATSLACVRARKAAYGDYGCFDREPPRSPAAAGAAGRRPAALRRMAGEGAQSEPGGGMESRGALARPGRGGAGAAAAWLPSIKPGGTAGFSAHRRVTTPRTQGTPPHPHPHFPNTPAHQ